MRRTVRFFGLIAVACLLLGAAEAQADELKSGLQVGDKISKFRIANCSLGDLKKQRL